LWQLRGDEEGSAMMRRAESSAAIAAVLLAVAGGAWAQNWPAATFSVAPLTDELESQIIHWVGPQVRVLQMTAYDEFNAGRARPIVLGFSPLKTGACRMSKAKLIIRPDGTGEFEATTMTLAANADLTWRTNILLRAADGRPLFGTGDFLGPEMNDGKASMPYVWVNKFTMDPATLRKVYGEIDHASVSYAC
jgi:hypothetical protein